MASEKTKAPRPKRKCKDGRPFGRPSSYDPKICQEMVEWFERPLTRTEIEQTASGGRVVNVSKVKANRLPTFEKFSAERRIPLRTLHEWRIAHQDFSHAWQHCKSVQADFMLQNALTRDFDPGFTKFMMMNIHGWKDSSKVENKSEENHTVNITYKSKDKQEE